MFRKDIVKKAKTFSIALGVLFNASKKHFILLFFFGILAGLPSLILLGIWKNIIDSIAQAVSGKGIEISFLVFLFCLHFLVSLSSYLLNKLLDYLTDIYVSLVECFVFNNILQATSKLSLAVVEQADFQNDIEKVNQDSTGHIMRAMDIMVELVKSSTTLIGTLVLLLTYNPVVILIIILSIIPLFAINKSSMDLLYKVYEERYEKIRFLHFINDIVYKYDSFKELKIFQAFDFIREKNTSIFDEIIYQDRQVKKRILLRSSLGEFLSMVFTYLFKIFIVIEGIGASLSIGWITLYIDAADRFQNACLTSIGYVLDLYEDCLYLHSYRRILDQVEEEEGEKWLGLIDNFSIDSIEVKNLSFRYGTRKEFALKDINLKLDKGKTYCIVGFNGSGKTTLAKLLSGLYDPSQGEIYINGQDRKNYKSQRYFSKVSVAFQEFFKLPLELKYNIAISDINRKIHEEDLLEAASFSEAQDFICDFPHGFEEKVGIGWNGAKELSTGQWQRINIARCFYKRADLYILDEPTSTLDLKTEYGLLKKIETRKKEAIHIIITHRFVNIKNVDQVIVLHEGRISSKGSHDELYLKDPIYTDLYNIHSEING